MFLPRSVNEIPRPTGLLYLDSEFIQLTFPFPLNVNPKILKEKETISPILAGSAVARKKPPSEIFSISFFKLLFPNFQSHGMVIE